MKNLFLLFLFATFLVNAQTVEKKHTDFELVANAKQVSEYNLKIPTDKFLGFDQIEKMVSDPSTKSRKKEEYRFNDAGFIIEEKEYFTDQEIIQQSVFIYDANNLLSEIIVKESDLEATNYSDYSKIKFERDKNELTKTWTYAKEDTIYFEKFILENNYIIEEKAPNSDNVRQKLTYDKNHNTLKGEIIMNDGKTLHWTNKYTFYDNGTVKSEVCTWTDLKTKTTRTYFPNGLLKSKSEGKENLEFAYKYDESGNWIYKIIYNNKKPSRLLKRDIAYH